MTTEVLIEVSPGHIALTATPILAIAAISWYLELGLGSPILVGIVRTGVQLTMLSFILDPIFSWGITLWWVVVGYTLVMVLLAAFESSARSKYFFEGMFWYVLAILLINVTWVALFAFFVILRPNPLWDPQYVIPIVGMILGNAINGISLSLNSMLTAMVESSREVELLLCFGANSYEASSRLIKEAARTGTMPQLNSMAIVGIISIPGMMTGQILGGSSVIDAARYQILITYLIAACAFGTIFTQLFSMLRICFDSRMMLRTDLLKKREVRPNALALIAQAYDAITACCRISNRQPRRRSSCSLPMLEESNYLSPRGDIHVFTSSQRGQVNHSCLGITGLSYSFHKLEDLKPSGNQQQERSDDEEIPSRRMLFRNISFQLQSGGEALIDGPSGVGKSTLLRILAGLTAPDEGTIELSGSKISNFRDMSLWRRQVLYVPQTKVDIPGTPIDFMKKICSFSVRSLEGGSSTYSKMKAKTFQLLSDWSMNVALLDSEWKLLSGGESQRVLLGVALSSYPRIILLDESTSSMDSRSKAGIEASVKQQCVESGMSAIWVTHDQTQKERIVKVIQQ
jgi:putative ABC transport system permease protein